MGTEVEVEVEAVRRWLRTGAAPKKSSTISYTTGWDALGDGAEWCSVVAVYAGASSGMGVIRVVEEAQLEAKGSTSEAEGWLQIPNTVGLEARGEEGVEGAATVFTADMALDM